MSHDRTSSTASSEAVFGSAARGDADAISDRDILIVDDDVAVLRERSRALANAGWSVASYTFAKLDALSQRGALFIQHIKLESDIAVDRDGRLAQALAAFKPHAAYNEEIRDNSLLAGLAGCTPIGPRGTLLAADILYVTVRNFGVLSLAERGIHVYAYNAIIEVLESYGLIAPGGARALAALRFLKCLYRAGEVGNGRHALATVEQALAVLPEAHFPSALRVVPAEMILTASSPPRAAPAYLQLRDLERRFVALRELERTPALDVHLHTLSRWIENPRAYASLSSRLAPKMREIMVRYMKQAQSQPSLLFDGGSAAIIQPTAAVKISGV
jgi:hypothetical protein